jgi:pyruvate ferredoxin oxidoreductase beta subunit
MSFIPNLKTVSCNPERLAGGHRMCPGCGLGVIVKQVLAVLGADEPVIAVNATGCLEICTSPYPQTSWRIPWIHSLFENTAAVASGIEAAVRAFERSKKLKNLPKIVAFAGDGGTYDIGLQALSGAVERGHNFTFVCLDNEGYMNTGYQRSSASPLGAATSTSPAGSEIVGKQTKRKDITAILAAHRIPYVAQASPHNHIDLIQKARRAFDAAGPAFLNVFSPCPTNWKSDPAVGMEICRAAADTNFWPLFEVKNGNYKINYKPKKRKPIEEFLTGQKRFQHLLKSENAELKNNLQKEVDYRFAKLLKLEEISKD